MPRRGARACSLDETTIRDDALEFLIDYVARMNLDNFIVRAKRRAVEKYQKREIWNRFNDDRRSCPAHRQEAQGDRLL